MEKRKGYKKILVGEGCIVVVDKVPLPEEFEEAQKGDTDLDKKVAKLDELNELAHKDLILSINTSSAVKKVAFGLARNRKVQFLRETAK